MNERVRRYGRLLEMGRQKEKQSERAFAGAVMRSADAAARLAHIESLILTTTPIAARQGVPTLMSAAALRGLLIPAAEAVTRNLEHAREERAEAERSLEQARARTQRLEEIANTVRRARRDEMLDREAEARPAPRESARKAGRWTEE